VPAACPFEWSSMVNPGQPRTRRSVGDLSPNLFQNVVNPGFSIRIELLETEYAVELAGVFLLLAQEGIDLRRVLKPHPMEQPFIELSG
jgi:hypothetical protein